MASKDVVNIDTVTSLREGFTSVNEEFKKNALLIEELKRELANQKSLSNTYIQDTDPALKGVKYTWWQTRRGELVTLWINVV